MPQFIPVIIAIAASASAAYIAYTVVVALAVTYMQYEGRKRAAAARAAYYASLQDRKLTLRSAVTPRRLLLGTARVGGVLVYADTVGTNQRLFDQELALCEGPIDGLEGFWLNEEFVSAYSMSGDRPSIGTYAAPSTASRAMWSTTMTGGNTFDLPNTPRSAADVKVSGKQTVGTANGVWITRPVSSVSGNTVTLASAFSGDIMVDYMWTGGDAPLRLQWQLGDQTAAQSWAGVTTPKRGTTDVCNGIARVRALMGWDENIYRGGPPQVSALARGLRSVFDPRRELGGCHALRRANPGAPGTLPERVGVTLVAGLQREVLAAGTDPASGLPYVDLRLYGTPTASGACSIELPGTTGRPSASGGQSWGARCRLRWLAGGSKPAITLALVSFGTAGQTRGAVNSADLAPTLATGDAEPALTATCPANTATVGACVTFAATSGSPLDVRLRVMLPLLWRTDVGSPYAYTSNSALLAAMWGTRPRAQGGCGRPWHLVDWASVAAAANVCDELITVRGFGGGYENIKRYACHTVLSLDASPADNLATILSSMAGEFVFTAGEYRLYAGAHITPDLTLTDADVVVDQPIRIVPDAGGLRAIPNKVTATFADARRNYTETSAKEVVNDTYVLADGGGEEPLNLNLQATTDERQANYLMGVRLEQARPGFTAELTVSGIGADIALKRGVVLRLSGYEAFNSLTWEVASRTNHFNGTYTLQLRQTKPWIWALDADRFTPTNPPPAPDLNYLWKVTPVTGFSVLAAAPAVLPDGTSVLRVECAWQAHAQDYVRQSGEFDLQWRRIDSTVWVPLPAAPGTATGTVVTIPADQTQRYVLAIRARNGLGAVSDWALDSVDVLRGPTVSALIARLTSSGIALPADTNGTVLSYAGASTSGVVIEDNVDTSANWTATATPSSGITANVAGRTVTVTNMTQATVAGFVDIVLKCPGKPDQLLRYTVSKGTGGAKGDPGDNGLPGGYTEYIFKRSATAPAAPTGITPVGWSDAPPAGSEPLWMARAVKTGAGALATPWSTPVRLDGDGTSVEYSADATNWHANFTAGDLYMRQKVGAGAWSGAIRIVGERGLQGEAGIAAPILVNYPTAQQFTFNGLGVPMPATQTITFTAVLQNMSGVPDFTCTLYSEAGAVIGTPTLGGGGLARTLTVGQFGSASYAVVNCSLGGRSDQVRVVRTNDGQFNVSVDLTNDSHTLPASSNGVVASYAGADTRVVVWEGWNNATDTWTITPTAGPGVTFARNGALFSVTGMADGTDVSWIEFQPTKPGMPTPLPVRFSITKSRAGTILLRSAGNCVISGNVVTFPGGTWGTGSAYTQDRLTGGAYAQATAVNTTSYLMFGLNTDPTTDLSYASLDYAMYLYGDGNLYAYMSGNNVGALGPYQAGDALGVAYDGLRVTWSRNGQILMTRDAPAGQAFAFDSAASGPGSLKDVQFGALSPLTGVGTNQLMNGAATGLASSFELSPTLTWTWDAAVGYYRARFGSLTVTGNPNGRPAEEFDLIYTCTANVGSIPPGNGTLRVVESGGQWVDMGVWNDKGTTTVTARFRVTNPTAARSVWTEILGQQGPMGTMPSAGKVSARLEVILR